MQFIKVCLLPSDHLRVLEIIDPHRTLDLSECLCSLGSGSFCTFSQNFIYIFDIIFILSSAGTDRSELLLKYLIQELLHFNIAQTSALTYRYINQAKDNLWAWVGIVIMALAIVGEATADRQKSAAKKVNPKRFCDTGLYKIVRCPNYFSEVLFWVGVTVSGIGAVQGKQWIIVIIALILITYVMYNSASRLELRHEKTYGLDPAYQKYSDTVPLLFPFTKQFHSMKVYRD